MVERFATEQRGLDEDAEIGDDVFLTAEIVETERTERPLEILVRLLLLPAYVKFLLFHSLMREPCLSTSAKLTIYFAISKRACFIFFGEMVGQKAGSRFTDDSCDIFFRSLAQSFDTLEFTHQEGGRFGPYPFNCI